MSFFDMKPVDELHGIIDAEFTGGAETKAQTQIECKPSQEQRQACFVILPAQTHQLGDDLSLWV